MEWDRWLLSLGGAKQEAESKQALSPKFPPHALPGPTPGTRKQRPGLGSLTFTLSSGSAAPNPAALRDRSSRRHAILCICFSSFSNVSESLRKLGDDLEARREEAISTNSSKGR